MKHQTIDRIFGLAGLIIVGAFTLGLAASIMSGFAGVLGGLPFLVITIVVLILLAYDCWDSTFKKRDP